MPRQARWRLIIYAGRARARLPTAARKTNETFVGTETLGRSFSVLYPMAAIASQIAKPPIR